MRESLFEHHGHFEELTDPTSGKVVGTRRLSAPPEAGREMGFYGQKPLTLTEDFTVDYGHKQRTIRVRKPITLTSRIYPICGRVREPSPGIAPKPTT